MNLKNKNIILKLVVFLVFLILSVFLFVLIRQNSSPDSNNILIPIIYITLVLSGFALFILSINFSEKTEIKLLENEVEIEKDEEIESSEDKPQEEQDKIDVEKLINTLLPKTSEEKDIEKFTEKLLSNFAKEFKFVQGIFFIKDKKKNEYQYCSDYAYFSEEKPENFISGETLPGQAAKNKKLIYLSDIPADYIKIISGLGESSPNFLLIAPVLYKNSVIGVFEFASFIEIKPNIIDAIEEIAKKSGEQINKLIKE